MGWITEQNYFKDTELSELVELSVSGLPERLQSEEMLVPFFGAVDGDVNAADDIVKILGEVESLATDKYTANGQAQEFADSAMAIMASFREGGSLDTEAIQRFWSSLGTLTTFNIKLAYSAVFGLDSDIRRAVKNLDDATYKNIVFDIMSKASELTGDGSAIPLLLTYRTNFLFRATKREVVEMGLKSILKAVKQDGEEMTLRLLQRRYGLVVCVDYKRLGSTGYKIKFYTLNTKIMHPDTQIEGDRDYSKETKPEGGSPITEYSFNPRGYNERRIAPMVRLVAHAIDVANQNLHRLNKSLQHRRYKDGQLLINNVLPYETFLHNIQGTEKALGHFHK